MQLVWVFETMIWSHIGKIIWYNQYRQDGNCFYSTKSLTVKSFIPSFHPVPHKFLARIWTEPDGLSFFKIFLLVSFAKNVKLSFFFYLSTELYAFILLIKDFLHFLLTFIFSGSKLTVTANVSNMFPQHSFGRGVWQNFYNVRNLHLSCPV